MKHNVKKSYDIYIYFYIYNIYILCNSTVYLLPESKIDENMKRKQGLKKARILLIA